MLIVVDFDGTITERDTLVDIVQEQAPEVFEQVEEDLDLLDDRVLAAGVEERSPVLPGRLQVVLAAGRVREHAVEVDNHGPAWFEGLAVPGPMLGEVPHVRR